MKKINLQLGLMLVAALLMTTTFWSCSDEEEATPEPIANFSFEFDETDWQTVNFTNRSKDAESVSWDFGDGETGTGETVSHTYAAAGDYDVTITATNGNLVDTKTETISVTDPFEALRGLAGESSKTWKLVREGIAMLQTSTAGDFQWSYGEGGISPFAQRPCLLNDEYIFHIDGTYEYQANGDFWGEYLIFDETCIDAVEANYQNLDGADVSDWMSNDGHSFDYDVANSTLTVSGTGNESGKGAFIVNPRIAENETFVPVESRTYTVDKLVTDGAVDTLQLHMVMGDAVKLTYWLVSYDNAADEPEIPTDVPEFGEDLEDITPETMGHTFETAESFDLLGTIEGATIITLGVDDPTDASATKVGEVTRIATDFQEAKLRVAPEPKDILFDNITTVSLDVYFPSSNDYSGDLNQNVVLGFADESQTQEWWTALTQYVSEEVPLDTWTTITFDLTTPAQQGPLVSERTSTDMIFLNFGGSAHSVEGTFYVRNLSFE